MPEGNVIVLPADEGDAEERELRNALVEGDVEETPVSDEPAAPTEGESKSESPTDKEEKKSDNSEPETDQDRPRDEKGRFLPKVEKGEVKPLEEGKPEPTADQQVEQPPQDKEQARLAKSWQKIQTEKLELRNTLAEVRQLKEQLQQQMQRPVQQPAQFDSKRLALAADEFERQAESLFANGDIDQGNQKLKLARETRQYAQQQAQQEHYEAQQTQAQTFERQWQGNAEVAIRQYPELGDPNSEAAQAMMELLEDYPILGYIPDGFQKGVEILKMRRDSASASELRAENDRLKTEIKALREKTAISGGGVTSKPSPVDFDNMSLEQQEAYLTREVWQQDASNSAYR